MRLALIVLLVASVYVYGRHLTPHQEEQFRQNGLLCSICKKLVDKITPFVKETNITGIAYGICDDITLGNQSLDQLCKNFIDDSIGGIVNDIQSGKTDDQTCADLDAC